MKFHGLQAKEKKNALVYLVYFFLYPMNKLALLSLLNALGDGNSMYCLLDGIEHDYQEKGSITFEFPAYVESANSEFGFTVTYPDGQSLTLPEMTGKFFGYVPAGTKIVSVYNSSISGSYYYLTKVDTKEK